MKKQISPSLLSADFFNLEKQLGTLQQNGMEFVHIDVMDGHFVPNITIGPLICNAISKHMPQLKLDIHLMIENPDSYIDSFAKSNPYIIYFHQEAENHIDRVIAHIKSYNIKAGITLNPATPVSVIEQIIPIVDSVLIMSVNPGFGGQKFIPYCKEKIANLYRLKEELNPNMFIAVDGGVNLQNAQDIAKAGADLLVAGSAVFSGNYTDNFRKLTNLINKTEVI
jgi:ribulose-phosphate 3-epimerase